MKRLATASINSRLPVTGDVRQVKYFATVDEILPPKDAELKRDPLDYKEMDAIVEDKKVIIFVPGSLYELEDPIPFETEYQQSLRYTTLRKIREASTTDDFF